MSNSVRHHQSRKARAKQKQKDNRAHRNALRNKQFRPERETPLTLEVRSIPVEAKIKGKKWWSQFIKKLTGLSQG